MLQNLNRYSSTVSYWVITRHCANCPGYLERNTAEKAVLRNQERQGGGGGGGGGGCVTCALSPWKRSYLNQESARLFKTGFLEAQHRRVNSSWFTAGNKDEI